MMDFLIYLLKASLVLAAAYLVYRWVMSKLTYFGLTRWLLLLQIGLVLSLPLIQLPVAWHPFAEEPLENVFSMTQKSLLAPAIIPEFKPSTHVLDDTSGPPLNVEWPVILTGVYAAGVFVFLLRMLVQLRSLLKLSRKAIRIEKHPNYQLVWCKDSIAPFSFFNQIFLPEQKLEPEIYSQIIQHEAIHIRQKHSLDITLTELLIVLFWFNPFAWLYRRAIEANLEFLTDQTMLKSGIPRKNYMLHLLKLTLPDWQSRLGLTYNQSLLQKRISMMNAKTSHPKTRWTYLIWIILMPLFTFCNEPMMSDWVAKSKYKKPIDLALIITEDASPEELQQLSRAFNNLGRDYELVITHLAYGPDGKISEIYPLLQSGNNEPGGTGYRVGPNESLRPVCILFNQNERIATRFLREIDMNELVNRYDQIHFLTAGIESSKSAIRQLQDNLGYLIEKAEQERIAELEKNGWKDEKSGWITYQLDAGASWENIEKRAKQTNAPELWYIVDQGAKQASRPAIPLDQIREIKFEYISRGYYHPETHLSERTEEIATNVHIQTK